jgi:Ca2+-dependent lipid-binding protein
VSPIVSSSSDQRLTVPLRRTTPNWNETHYLLLNSTTGILSLGIKDWNEHRADSELGIVNFDLASLHEDGQQEGINGEVILDGKARGTVRFDAVYYPILTQKKLADGTEEPIPETSESPPSLSSDQY